MKILQMNFFLLQNYPPGRRRVPLSRLFLMTKISFLFKMRKVIDGE